MKAERLEDTLGAVRIAATVLHAFSATIQCNGCACLNGPQKSSWNASEQKDIRFSCESEKSDGIVHYR
jgi:hypothetical protein